MTDKKAIDQPFLQVKLAKTNAATNGIKLTVSGIDAKDDPSTDDLPVNDELAIPSTIKQDEKTTTDTAVGINWSPVTDALSYDVKADGMVYRSLKNQHSFCHRLKNKLSTRSKYERSQRMPCRNGVINKPLALMKIRCA